MMTAFRTGGKAADGYLVLPKTSKGPGVLVIHAWWGLTDFFKGLCDRLAGEGFVSLAPDLYHGATASTIEEAKKLRSKLKSQIVAKEVTGALEHLRSHPAVNVNKVGVVGFSLGAYYALGLTVLKPNDVVATVIFYGTRTAKYAKTKAAFLGHFAEDDKWAPVKKVRQLESSIRSAGREVTFHTYLGTKHWFFEKDRPEYSRDAAEESWQRTVNFLRSKLT